MRSGARPSIVVTRLPAAADSGTEHERIGFPSRWTVHAPHCAMPQPNLVPVMFMTSRSTQRSGISGAAETVRRVPLTMSQVGDTGGLLSGRGMRGCRGSALGWGLGPLASMLRHGDYGSFRPSSADDARHELRDIPTGEPSTREIREHPAPLDRSRQIAELRRALGG